MVMITYILTFILTVHRIGIKSITGTLFEDVMDGIDSNGMDSNKPLDTKR